MGFVGENADNVDIEETKQGPTGIRGSDREPNGDVGESEWDRDGCCHGLELGVMKVGAEGAKGCHYEYQQVIVKFEGQVEMPKHAAKGKKKCLKSSDWNKNVRNVF